MSDFAERSWAEDLITKELCVLAATYSEEVINEFIVEYNLNRFLPYICCFSTSGDILSQWRAYADDGHGFSIGFDSTAISHSKELPMMSFKKDNLLSLQKVIYDEEEQRKIISSLLNAALDRIKITQDSRQNSDNKTDEQIVRSAAGAMAIQNLSGFSVISKNPAFSEEKEYRLLHMPMMSANRHTNETISTQFAISEPQYRISRKRVCSYFEYDFSKLMVKKFIVEIIRGPKNQTEHSDLSTLLGEFKYKIELKDSRATYR